MDLTSTRSSACSGISTTTSGCGSRHSARRNLRLSPTGRFNRRRSPASISYKMTTGGTAGWNFGAALDAKITGRRLGWPRNVRSLSAGTGFSARRRAVHARQSARALIPFLSLLDPIQRVGSRSRGEFRHVSTARPTRLYIYPSALSKPLRLPVTARWFSPLGLFAGLTTSFIHQDVSRRGASAEEGSSTFAIVDAAAGYRFPDRRGLVSLEVRNLFDSAFRYQDDSFRAFTNEPSVGPYIPERTLIARLAVNF